MRTIFVPTADAVIAMNKFICEQGGNPHHCNEKGKVESAIHSAFYPGSFPFSHGGFARVAGALCFYLVKSHAFTDGNKRTGALAGVTFLNQHGLDLQYPVDVARDIDAFAQVIDDCAAGRIDRDRLMDWFESHKTYLDDE